MKLHTRKAFTLIELMIVIAIIAIIAAIAIPNLIEARKHGNESAAIGSLKAIASAQALFREGDRETDTTLDYGSLAELSATNLIDPILGTGTKSGYTFAATADLSDIANSSNLYRWEARAQPASQGTTGDRSFITNQSGVIYFKPSPYTAGNGFASPVPGTALGQ
ncbi:MAG: prepilin-type N-terminal cleavage/methylation domain-containing protein [Planctomycetota bacterium]